MTFQHNNYSAGNWVYFELLHIFLLVEKFNQASSMLEHTFSLSFAHTA